MILMKGYNKEFDGEIKRFVYFFILVLSAALYNFSLSFILTISYDLLLEACPLLKRQKLKT